MKQHIPQIGEDHSFVRDIYPIKRTTTVEEDQGAVISGSHIEMERVFRATLSEPPNSWIESARREHSRRTSRYANNTKDAKNFFAAPAT